MVREVGREECSGKGGWLVAERGSRGWGKGGGSERFLMIDKL